MREMIQNGIQTWKNVMW